MKERKENINIVTANIVAIVFFLGASVACTLIQVLLWRSQVHFDPPSPMALMAYAAIVLVAVVVHEVIHGITWAHYAKQGWRGISFGIMWKMLTPYCHCSEPLLVKHYRTGCLMPLIVLGMVPAVVGIAINSLPTTWFGAIFISGAAGDIMIAWRLRKEPRQNLVLDHPTEAGYLVYEEDPTA